MTTRRSVSALAFALALIVAGCAAGEVGPTTQPSPSTGGTATLTGGSVVIVGRVVTMADPPLAEAIYIQDGLVAAVGSRDEVLAAAADGVPVVDIGKNVAYPGFIDAHSHWIGDRDYYGVDTAEAAMDAAVTRGWTSISEQWVNPERLVELTGLAEDEDEALPLRVDAYLALNYELEFFGDWYEERQPGPVDDDLQVKGVKIHLDDGWADDILWQPADLTTAIKTANDAGWQVSVHAMSSAAVQLALDAFESVLGTSGANPLHHRIEHALQVTDEQLARLVAVDLATVIHLDGESGWMLDPETLPAVDKSDPDQIPLLGRWRDFVDAGLHVASATDAPWTFPDLKLIDDIGRPTDHIASGMDGRVRESQDLPAWAEGQQLTAEQGLRAVTMDAAWALGDETRRGHLATGTLGDVTVLSGDVLDATPDEIRAMTVIATIVGGISAYCADDNVCPAS